MATGSLGTLRRHLEKLAATGRFDGAADGQLLEEFAARHSETAFTTLVGRHGPMVLRVCQRVLRQEQDAEDAFQATFLLLAQNSNAIRKREALAGWLHGVAYRTAMKAKRTAARRRNREAQVKPATASAPDPSWSEVQAILDGEIERLPNPFRSAFVLCVLQGKTVPEAALALECKPGTVSSRLTRARQLLRQRLARRGIELSSILAALAVADGTGQAAVPTILAKEALRISLLGAAGWTAAETIPAKIAALAAGVSRAMGFAKVKMVSIILLAVSLTVAGAGLLARQALANTEQPSGRQASALSQPKPEHVVLKPTPRLPVADERGRLVYAGRVLGPDGRPVAGAKIHMTVAWGYAHHPVPSPAYATSGPDGRFRFTVSRVAFGEQHTVVAAKAAHYSAGWVQLSPGADRGHVTIRLGNDDGPITGQIVDLEGKPVPNATLTVLQINAAPADDLGPWLAVARAGKDPSLQLEQQCLKRFTLALPFHATTDANGRLRLLGIGRNRLVRAQLHGPTIASQDVCILTRAGEPFRVTEWPGRPELGLPARITTYYGANFRLAAAPTQPITGVVRDKDTHQPLAGFTVMSTTRRGRQVSEQFDIVRTTTDAQGHYRLVGLPTEGRFGIMAVPTADQPYGPMSKLAPELSPLAPAVVDFELKRGVWIEGRITDKVTGKPLRAGVEYSATVNNPNRKDYPGFGSTMLLDIDAPPREDGTYRIVGLPGPGVVSVMYGQDHYLRANERDDEFGTRRNSKDMEPFLISFSINYSALSRIDVPKGVKVVKRDITLNPGSAFTVKLLDPDGRPLAGTQPFDLNGHSWWQRERLPTPEFKGRFNPGHPHEVFFQHPEKELVGIAPAPKKDGDILTVRLQPAPTVRGRLVDAHGRPRPGVQLQLSFRPNGWQFWPSYADEPLRTDGQGRFHVSMLLPGYEFRLSDGNDELRLTDLRAGENRDVGDVPLKPISEREP
ncbi:MAG TPA: sigma-70 family RNA polymerase sigma factor [Gemmataceae bacterium]|nr:sigma-70 family RNA polymerase sigma factor [Gemmataceae bacterium]